MLEEVIQSLIEEMRGLRVAMEHQHDTPSPASEYVTRQEAAAILRCSLPTLDKLRAEGRLPWAKPGQEVLIRREDIDRFMREEFAASIR